MRVIRRVQRRPGRAVVVSATVGVLASGLSPGAAAAQAAFDACPEPFPVAEVEAGMVGTGLTVETGTEPDEFTATVLGVIADGIGPDIDMVVADIDSPAVDRAGGIWQGMSGSPVYAPDGRLIGAVAFSLGTLSPVAGITPAADMRTLLDRPVVEAPAAAEQVDLPAALEQQVVDDGAATSAEAAAGLRRLPLPLGVSGINQNHLDDVATRLEQRIPGSLVHAAGAAPVDEPGSQSDIFPGSNFAAAISYGDVTVSGVGTTTMVCPGPTGDVALAFGHPLGQLGATSLSGHSASAVHVQTDAVIGPFKEANAGGTVGTLDQDRLVGVRGLLGTAPESIPVTSTVLSVDDGAQRTGTSRVNMQQFLPLVGPDHLVANLDRVIDRIGGGVSAVRWVVRGERASGEPFTLDAANWYADQADITTASAQQLSEHLALLDTNPFETVRITGVELTGLISSTFRHYSLDDVLVRQPDGSYDPAPTDAPLPVVAGSELALRLVLTPYQGRGEVRNVDVTLAVPDEPGAAAALQVTGGRGSAPPLPPAPPRSLDDLLTQLGGEAPNNSVTATVTTAPAGPPVPPPPGPTPPGPVPPGPTPPTPPETPAPGPTPAAAEPSARQVVDQVVLGERLIPVLILEP